MIQWLKVFDMDARLKIRINDKSNSFKANGYTLER